MRHQVAAEWPTVPIPDVSGDVRVGTQGWNYHQWAGPFYPEGTRAEDYLRLYARAFSTVEVDSTFYAIPPEKVVRGWASKVPESFRFALKLPQEITHVRRLVDCRDVLEEFAERARALGQCLGPILVQFGPEFGPEHRPALERFLPLLAADIRFAVEFRQPQWLTRGILDLLREHRVSLALVEGRWVARQRMLQLAEGPTGEIGYVRLMGPDRTLEDWSRVQVDRGPELAEWALALARLAERVTAVHVYVNNHFEGHSPASARRLQALLGQSPVEPSTLAEQTELF
jgi:uncharacterized protein YecE (DUF72 family)